MRVHVDGLHASAQETIELEGVEFFQPTALVESVEAGAEELVEADAGDFHGMLEGEEEAGAGAVFGKHFEQVLSLIDGAAPGDFVAGPARQDEGEGALAGAVGAHDGVNLAGVYVQVHAAKDGGVVNASV